MGEVATRHDNLRIPITAKDRIPGDTPYYGANGIQDYVEGYTHEGEFVLVAEDGATDLDNYPVQLISGLSWVNNHAHVIKAIPDVAQNRFIMHLIKSMDIASYLVGGTRSKLNAEVLMGIELKLPSNSEQIYIGSLLSTLDSLITLHQRECRKASFIRPSAWEQRKFGEIFEEYSEKNRADLPPLTIIQGGGTVYRDESNRNLQFDKNSLSDYKAVNPDDFIVHLRSFEGGLEKATCCGLISPAYHTFHGDDIDSDFYYLYFRSKRFIDTDLKPHVYGIRDGRSVDIGGMKTIPVPWTTVNEQRTIGGFYNSLDSLITLHQRQQ